MKFTAQITPASTFSIDTDVKLESVRKNNKTGKNCGQEPHPRARFDSELVRIKRILYWSDIHPGDLIWNIVLDMATNLLKGKYGDFERSKDQKIWARK